MTAATAIKQLAIGSHVYPLARWLKRRLRPQELVAHRQQVQLYRELIPAGSLCFDVGANVGSVTEALLMAGMQVIAFEPNPEVLPELRARCGRKTNWTLIVAALGSQADIATLYARKSDGQSSLLKDWEGEIIATYNVPVISMDAAIHKFGVPFYCKIDVEGYELEVLRGMSSPTRLLSFEFHLTEADVAKTLTCLQALEQLGYQAVNLTGPESSQLLLAEWRALAGFREWFPQQIKQLVPPSRYGQIYGDIWVRRD